MLELMAQDTLARYPYPIVRIACRYCQRKGRYRLETFVERHGAAMTLGALLESLTGDCQAALDRTGKLGCKGAYLPDLERRRR
jgi:hypothetical protein